MYDHLATAAIYEHLSCRFNLIVVIPRVSNCGFHSANFSVDDRVILCAPCLVLQQGGSLTCHFQGSIIVLASLR